MDPALVGWYRVKGFDMVVGRTVSLIGGLPGERVEFTEDGRYRVWELRDLAGDSRYAAWPQKKPAEMDVWIPGMDVVSRCAYELAGKELRVCVGGDHGPRPTEIRRDDERLWCVIRFERCKAPRAGKAKPAKPTVEPGSFIPTAWKKKAKKAGQ
jgi:hypothetical protein